MGVSKLIQDAIKTICEQAVSGAPYDKTRGGVIRGEGSVPNTYNVQVDGVVYTNVKTTGGISPNINDTVTVIFPTNNSSQMVINSVSTQSWIKGASEFIYPVGAYYWTSDANFNPNNSFSGAWEKIDAGVTLVSAGTGYTVTTGTAKDGGSPDAVVVEHNHTQNEHHHGSASTAANAALMTIAGAGTDIGLGEIRVTAVTTGTNYVPRSSASGVDFIRTVQTSDTTATNIKTGVAGTKKNMPPYKCAYCWHRVA